MAGGDPNPLAVCPCQVSMLAGNGDDTLIHLAYWHTTSLLSWPSRSRRTDFGWREGRPWELDKVPAVPTSWYVEPVLPEAYDPQIFLGSSPPWNGIIHYYHTQAQQGAIAILQLRFTLFPHQTTSAAELGEIMMGCDMFSTSYSHCLMRNHCMCQSACGTRRKQEPIRHRIHRPFRTGIHARSWREGTHFWMSAILWGGEKEWRRVVSCTDPMNWSCWEGFRWDYGWKKPGSTAGLLLTVNGGILPLAIQLKIASQMGLGKLVCPTLQMGCNHCHHLCENSRWRCQLKR